MTDAAVEQALVDYAAKVRADRRANAASLGTGPELLLAPTFATLVTSCLATFAAAPPAVLPEYTKAGIGRPDLALKRPGQPARAFIELKHSGHDLAPRKLKGHDDRQFARFSELPLWAYCNFHAMHLYERGTRVADAVVVPEAALDPATPEAKAERLIRARQPSDFLAILQRLSLAQPASPRTAAAMAQMLAQGARLVREVVADLSRDNATALASVRGEFNETLFAHPAAGGHGGADDEALFAGAFAQTLTFGLLLVREATGKPVGRNSYQDLPEPPYPLLRATLRAITQDEMIDALGVSFDVIVDTVNAVDPALLTPRGGRDPILYFYEDFLGTFDSDARAKHGVFFTPVPVVKFIVAETDRALRDTLGTKGLLDPSVLLLDPACGTGTFLIAAASAAAAMVDPALGPSGMAAEMEALAGRLHGFELLVGAYTVAHYRLTREFASRGASIAKRLPIYLADTLAPPGGATNITPRLGIMSAPIVAERLAADTLKAQVPIIAILGNPAYRRLGEGEEAALVSGWDNGFWDDLKDPVRRAGWGGELNTFPDLYVAFWRWCLWKLFESDGAPKRGVICMITNRTFLSGHPYAGLRKMMRERFDFIDIVDLRGDQRGARPAGIDADENVFAIQTGVCILRGVATGGAKAGLARVRYADAWRHGKFTKAEKEAWLDAGPSAMRFVPVERELLDDFLARPFDGTGWLSIQKVFGFSSSGVQTKRDDFAYSLTPSAMRERVVTLNEATSEEATDQFHVTRDRPVPPKRA